ncbi:Nse1 non-SMC component of SMC5-6 complex [Nesidiocoris tenuis]|uniref:Non-structural maintenance of chromosomes element 1 homolog n=1 Tax=Nesidiocoris tenuis TaxID=355587 RepID=A0ABN7BEG4_9HEMI|nr:Nse1 non-SMC component of SMC5-6 complex [Nesidiocoris tenuis]
MRFSDDDRSVLHFFMADQIVDQSDLVDILAKITNENASAADCEIVIERINHQVEKFCQKIVKVTCELTGQKSFALISTAAAPGMKSQFSKEQIAYFHALMDSIVQNEGRIDSITAINMASDATDGKVTVSNAESQLLHFVNKKLLMSDGSNYYLSPIAIAEYGSFISAHYETASCAICQKMTIFGQQCASCLAILHKHCLKDYLRNTAQAKCPSCQNAWQFDDF